MGFGFSSIILKAFSPLPNFLWSCRATKNVSYALLSTGPMLSPVKLLLLSFICEFNFLEFYVKFVNYHEYKITLICNEYTMKITALNHFFCKGTPYGKPWIRHC